MFPQTGEWAGGEACLPAALKALNGVNQRVDVLPGYYLNLSAYDTRCSPGLGTTILYELLYNKTFGINSSILMLLGPACSPVSTAVGEAAKMWNLIVLSYGSSSPALSNRVRFATFFRTHPPATLHNPTRIKFFQLFNWKRIAILIQTEEVWQSTAEHLEQLARENNIHVAVRQLFDNDPSHAISNLKKDDIRIIVGLFYEEKARKVFCQAYQQNYFGEGYVWWTIGWYADNWFLKVNDIDCTEEQMMKAVEGHFTTEIQMLTDSTQETISNITPQSFVADLNSSLRELFPYKSVESVGGYVEAPLAYDATWALALALNRSLNRTNLEKWSYDNSQMKNIMMEDMENTQFFGVSGFVKFDKQGNRMSKIVVEQLRNGVYHRIARFDAQTGIIEWLRKEEKDGKRCWNYKNTSSMDRRPPFDQLQISIQVQQISRPLYITMSCFAALGFIFALACLIFNIVHRKHKIIQQSKPLYNNCTLVGGLILLTNVFVLGADSQIENSNRFVQLCQIKACLLAAGFSICYGAILAKLIRVYLISTKKASNNYFASIELCFIISILLIIDVIVFTIWILKDPLHFTSKETREGPILNDIKTVYQIQECRSKHHMVWIGLLYSIKGCLIILGIYLSYETRNIKLENINDSHLVRMSSLTLIIERNQDADFAFTSIAIILCCFVSYGLIFLPKFLRTFRTTGEEETTNQRQTPSTEDEEKHRKLMIENEQLKSLIAEREVKMNELIEKLRQKGINIVIRDTQRHHSTNINNINDSTAEEPLSFIMRRRSTFLNPITMGTCSLTTKSIVQSNPIDNSINLVNVDDKLNENIHLSSTVISNSCHPCKESIC
ncbi:unnamed protein product [Didymodactylos carnosus]|uniref:G-protein coupled receptors family 3 profile domain-containing protein n=1 Tax=Didymodactylos carnosus TaxID=1234261 RepID=A0A813QSF3_9BILA|nr:unnamed protein product [Didymodactylos carnosus]CAF0940511.1 unnamed protein product [Didymodactylos carnosus]CAF3555024.1 unnamed protein product [Didymodactylos carnosus]CAF3715703.1 unnamed protein product [Didymodactylos carnosus]